jgi:hypothetical protein
MLRTAGSFWPGDAAAIPIDEITDNANAENAILLIILDPSIDGLHYNIFDSQMHKVRAKYLQVFDLKEAWESPLQPL